MFTKLKQFKDLRSQAKNIQGALSKESVTSASNGVSVTLDGNLVMTNIIVPADLLTPEKKEKLEAAIKDAHGDAIKKIQRIMAAKMKEMGGLPNIPGLS